MATMYSNDVNNDLHLAVKPILYKYHGHLEDANFLYLWRDTEKKNKDEISYGEVIKANDIVRHLTGANFIMTVYRYGWDTYLMPDKKLALIDNLLSHCKIAMNKEGFPKSDTYGDPVWQLIKPDAEMFFDVLKRRGAWNETLETVFHIVENSEDTKEVENETSNDQARSNA